MRFERNKLLTHQTALFLYALGFCLLAIVVLAPDAGHVAGRSFFKVAEASPWDRWWDWAAAWCSVKIILLSLGAGSLLSALAILLKLLHRHSLAHAVFMLAAVFFSAFCMGAFFLVKAVL